MEKISSPPTNDCRLCFSSSPLHLNIFSNPKNVAAVIREIFCTEVEEYDCLPNHICVDCWMTVRKFHRFYRNVQAAQNRYLAEMQPPIKAEQSICEPWTEIVQPIVSESKYGAIIESVVCDRSDFEHGGDDLDNLDIECCDDDSNEDDMENETDCDVDYTPKSCKNKGTKTSNAKKLKSNQTLFKCPHCEKCISRKHRLADHINKRHGYKCSICDERLASEKSLHLHSKLHEDGFEDRLRQKIREVYAIDTSVIDDAAAAEVLKQFDMKCDECSATFESLNQAQSHYLSEHESMRGYIKCCDIKLRDENLVKEHITYHLQPEQFFCFACDKTFKLKTYLRTHMATHRNLLDKKKHHCRICGKFFAQKGNMTYHMIEYHTKQCDQIVCELCGNKFLDEKQKEKHLRNSHEIMSSEAVAFIAQTFDMTCDQCEVMFESFFMAKRHYLSEHNEPKGYLKCCGLKFKSMLAIDKHIDWHKNPETLKCSICFKKFKIIDRLKSHMKSHGLKSHACEICGKTYKRKSTLDVHRQNFHQNAVKNFPCRYCSLKFYTEEKRNVHEQLIHFGDTTKARTVCDICGKGFLQASHLHQHVKAHHSDKNAMKAERPEEREMCTICGLWLPNRYRLKHHRKLHKLEPKKCDQCGLEAPSQDALLGHIRTFHQNRRKFKCRLCDDSFDLRAELRKHGSSHSSEKLYHCQHCSENFIWKPSLEAHIKTMHSTIKSSGGAATEK